MKTVTINKVKVKIFEEHELREKLRLSEDEISLIIKYQRDFPELLQNESEFCINARQLYDKLNVGAEYTTWIKRRIEKYKFAEGVDFTRFDKSVKAQNTYVNTKEYMVNVEMGKELAMVENSEIGREVRKYFIIMDKALRSYEEWELIREPEKNGYNVMKQYISEWCNINGFDSTIEKFYTREADMINVSLTGKTALELKAYLGYNDRVTREHLDSKINKAISELQNLNISLLIANMSFDERREIIKRTCDNRYSDLKLINN